MLWKLYHQYYLFENKFSNRNILQFFISQDLDYVNTPYNEEMLEDTMGAYQFSSLFSPKLIRCQQFKGNKLKYIKKKNLILAMYSKKVLLYDYNQYLKKHEINVGCQVLDITSDSYRIIYIYCIRSLIKWDLNQFKKKQEYIIEPIYQYLHYSVQLYYLQDKMIFFNKDHEIYYLDLKNNDSCQIKKHPKTQYEIFLSSEEGNMFLLFTYSKNKGYNYFRVFTYQN